MEKKTDREIIERVTGGETDAYSIIIDRYSDKLFSLIHRMTGSRDDAQDILQEVFVKAFFSLKKFKFKSKFSTWLYRIAYNTTLNEIRKIKKHRGTDIEETEKKHFNKLAAEEPDGQDREALYDILEDALEKLKAEDKMMLLFFYKEEKSIRQISLIMNISEANVRIKLHRIKKKLKEIIPAEAK